MGRFYNDLDSLLTFVEVLRQEDYSPDTWANVGIAAERAREAMSRNYSYTTSAADTLESAFMALKRAVEALQPATSVKIAGHRIPEDFSLSQNFPNPFNSVTTLNYHLPARAEVSLKIIDLRGRELAVLRQGLQDAGRYELRLDGSWLPSGTYLCQLRVGERVATRKLTVVK